MSEADVIVTSHTAKDSLTSEKSSRWARVVVCALVFVALVDAGFVAAIAPQIAADFNVNRTLVAGSVAVYAVAAASVALVLGAYATRFRAVVWLPLAAVLFLVAAILAAASTQLAVFYTARALAGFAGGLISALAIAALADASSYARRGRQMSLVAVTYFLAPVVGVPAAALITQSYHWRLPFVLVAALSSIVGILVWRLPLTARAEGAHDAHTIDARANRASSNVASASNGRDSGVANLGAFKNLGSIRTQFDSRSKLMGVVGAFFVSGGVVGFTSFVGVWLYEAFNRQPREVALVYAVAGAAAVAGGALGGLLADRYGKRRIALHASLGLTTLLLLVATFSWSITLVALMGLTAFVAAMRIAPLQALITELVEATERAGYIAWRNASSQIGIATAVWLSAIVYTRFGLFGVAFVCAVFTIFAWLCTRLISEPQTSDAPPVKPQRRFGVVRRALVSVLTLVIAVAFALPYLLSFAVTKAGTRSDERNRTDTPATYGAAFEEAAFASADGIRLSGWYLPADERDDKRVTIVMTHGLFRSRYEMLERAVELRRRGYAVLLYDLRRHGKSGGEFSTIGYNERLDVIAALDFAQRRAPANRFVLLGVSMGAAATLLAASEVGERVSAVIAESSFLSFEHTISHHVELARVPTFPFAALLVNLTAWRMNFYPRDFDVRRAVERITAPILFIGGGRDTRMPTESVLEPLYAAARNPLKRKLIVPEAKHGQAYAASPAQYVREVEEFLAQIF